MPFTDALAPTVRINTSSSVVADPIVAQFLFTEAVSGFTVADIAVTGGTVVAASFQAISSLFYTVQVTPASIKGDVVVSVITGSCSDLIGNLFANDALSVATFRHGKLRRNELGPEFAKACDCL